MSSVLVAMSGGVDSSVAALLLKNQGHEVLGVHMKLHDEVKEVIPKSCCGQQDAIDARHVCDELNIPYFVTDYRVHFQKFVLQNFISEYENGRTPIPCTHCNGTLKFQLLIQLAENMGYDYVATGHYAQMVDGQLSRATDKTKDQSYFLFPIAKEYRNKILFPLAELTKPEIRELAAHYELPTAEKQESQNLCFAPGGTHKEFLARTLPNRDGKIVHEDGTHLGTHTGIHNFTIGQRKGLEVQFKGQPLFVTRIDNVTNTVFVSHIQNSNAKLSFRIQGWTSWTNDNTNLSVVTRYRQKPIEVQALEDIGDRMLITTTLPATTVPGQAAVVYSGDRVVGGGWIE